MKNQLLFLLLIFAFPINIAPQQETTSNAAYSQWVDKAQKTLSNKKKNHYYCIDKFNNAVIIEWQLLKPHTLECKEAMKRTAPIVVEANKAAEVTLIKNIPEVIHDPFVSQQLEPLYLNGTPYVEWHVVEETLEKILLTFYKEELDNDLDDDDCLIVVTAKDHHSDAILGAIYFFIESEYDYGKVMVPILGILPTAQNRGLGKLLMSSIFKLLPQTKLITLIALMTNEHAHTVYITWGFKQFYDPTNRDPYSFNFEYDAAHCDILQNVIIMNKQEKVFINQCMYGKKF